MSKKVIFYTLFFAALTLGFYFVLSSTIPGYSDTRFPPVSKVQPFTFTNQDGDPFTRDDMKDKVSVVNFFFTTCTGICPKMNGNIRNVYEVYKNNPEVIFLSFTSDPKRDSVPVLKDYASSFGVNTDKWVFLTGTKDSLYHVARHSFKIDNPDNFVSDETVDFIHTQFVALVNKNNEVIRIYDGLKPSELKKLQADIQLLLNKS